MLLAAVAMPPAYDSVSSCKCGNAHCLEHALRLDLPNPSGVPAYCWNEEHV
jgi:hypothetical protein